MSITFTLILLATSCLINLYLVISLRRDVCELVEKLDKCEEINNINYSKINGLRIEIDNLSKRIVSITETKICLPSIDAIKDCVVGDLTDNSKKINLLIDHLGLELKHDEAKEYFAKKK
ncbi:MAG: hypothetical protein M0R06_02045 [Sphaerochaeta sp.]|jgi:hypothetical protein|nr:hypothetical protein [Sphaerochaeta sp.]